MMKEDTTVQNAWFHAVLSFVILLHGTNGEKRVISRDSGGAYYANVPGGILPFDGADTLYSAFCWFHSHLEEHAALFKEAYAMYGFNPTFLHILNVHPISFRNPPWLKAPLLDLPKVRRQKSCSLSPLEFYRLLVKANKSYSPDLYILDLDTDIILKKELLGGKAG